MDENPWICTLSRVVYKQRHYTLRTRARGIAGACTIIPRCLSNVCVRSIYVYTYIYRYVCIYVYIYIYTSVWPLGEYEAAFLVLRRKDRDEGHTKASPCIPLVVENYISCRVADPWIGFWVSAYPRDMFTSLASSPSHSSSFYYSLSLLLTSSHVDFSIPSYLRLFFRSWNSWETLSREREEKKKELWFSFAFEREFFSTFPSLSRNPLVSVTFSYFPFLRPSLFSWHGAHSSLVVLRLTLDLAYWFMHLSLILLRFFIPLPAYANRTSVSSSSTHPSPPLIHQFVALNPLLQVSFTLASFPFAARLRSSRNKHTGIIILRCLAIS